MNIAILGTGPIGSTFAFHLSRAGHNVTCIARGERLSRLRGDGAIVAVDGQRAEINVADALDMNEPYDLVLVTVLAHKCDAVMPALKASAAKTVMFMFNQFAALDGLRGAVGPSRFAFGFPAILATLPDGRLKSSIYTVGQTTIVTEARWAELFTSAGIRTVVEPDMQAWLRTHAVLIATMMSMGGRAHERAAGIHWAEAETYARALHEGFRLVAQLGDRITPTPMRALNKMPTKALAGLFWAMSRTKLVREVGAIGPAEPRALTDEMLTAASTEGLELNALRSIRP